MPELSPPFTSATPWPLVIVGAQLALQNFPLSISHHLTAPCRHESTTVRINIPRLINESLRRIISDPLTGLTNLACLRCSNLLVCRRWWISKRCILGGHFCPLSNLNAVSLEVTTKLGLRYIPGPQKYA